MSDNNGSGVVAGILVLGLGYWAGAILLWLFVAMVVAVVLGIALASWIVYLIARAALTFDKQESRQFLGWLFWCTAACLGIAALIKSQNPTVPKPEGYAWIVSLVVVFGWPTLLYFTIVAGHELLKGYLTRELGYAVVGFTVMTGVLVGFWGAAVR